MSRHTRALRKQARAQAAAQRQHQRFSGGTALLDEPETTTDEAEGERAGEDCDTPTAWTPAAPQGPARSTDGQGVAPEAKGTPSGSSFPARPVLAGRTAAVGTGAVDPAEPANPEPAHDGWLWRDKILAGDLVVLVGEEGAGKTRVLTDWIARVTSGQPFPGTPDPSGALPPSDVLVFNCVDNFQQGVLNLVAQNGGDPRRVIHASAQLLDWGHCHSEFPAGDQPGGGVTGGERPETRVRLHTQEILRKLEQFLLRRPSIRLVVIDQLKQHLRIDSERVFEDLIYDLQVLARHTGAAFVLTQRPDAFRNGTGTKQYFKSESLTSVARSIWRVAEPTDPAHGHRVLECLKLNYGFHKQGRHPWRLWQEPGQPMRWEVGNGQEFALSKLDAKERLLFQARTFITLYLRMFGGLADFQTLCYWGRKEGISGSKLMDASLIYNFGFEFEGSPDSDSGMRKVIGEWADIQKRQAIPEAERPPVVGPPVPKRRKKPAPLAPQPAARATTPAAPPSDLPTVVPLSRSTVPAPRSTPSAPPMLESLRARVARGEARLKEFDLGGFRLIKPNLATCHLLLNLQAGLGSEGAVLDFLREGLEESARYSAAEIETSMGEYRRLLQIARQVEAEPANAAAAQP